MHSARRLFVDVSVISRKDAGTGIQRVVRALWSELAQIHGRRFEIVPIAGSRKRVYRRIPQNFLEKPLKRLPLNFGRRRIRPEPGDVFLGIDLSTHVMPRNWRQLERWRATGVQIAALVYDLLPLQHPEWFSDVAGVRFRRWAEGVVTHCDSLICISRTVAAEVRHWIDSRTVAADVPVPAVSSIRLAGTIERSSPTKGFPVDHAAVLRWMRSARTVLMVGTIEPRKGHDQAIAAFELLRQQGVACDLQILFVGRAGWKTAEFQQYIMGKHERDPWFKWINDASDEYLVELYRACSGVLVASRGEGFGLPILEAAQFGKPILVRDIPVFREIAPEGVSFFTGETDAALADALVHWQQGGRGVTEVRQPVSWRQTTLEFLQAAADPTLEYADLWGDLT
jgi:glycosyltransferase involved in cell wall biosynthesis